MSIDKTLLMMLQIYVYILIILLVLYDAYKFNNS